MNANYLSEMIRQLGMSPNGLILGLLGSIISLSYGKRETLGFLRIVTALFSGSIIGAIAWEYFSIKKYNTPVISIITFFVGYMSSDMLKSIKSASPTITNWIVEKWIKRIKNGNNKQG